MSVARMARTRPQMLFVGSEFLRHALTEYAEHDDRERPPKRIGNRLVEPEVEAASHVSAILPRARLGGHLNFDRRAAA